MVQFGDMHHVGITVRDLDESIAWCERIFDITPDNPGSTATSSPSTPGSATNT